MTERPRPPYLIKRQGWKGQTVWYYWKRPEKQVRIKGDYGTREFWENYEIASGKAVKAKPDRQPTETLGWLIERYRDSVDWRNLAEGTRRVRDRILHKSVRKQPSLSYRAVNRALIVKTRDAIADTPAAANNFLDTFRGLFAWAVDAGFVEYNPVTGVKTLKRAKDGGFRQWTQEDMDAFKDKWPIGTRERLAFELLIHTGLRRGDVARLGKQHIRNGRLYITTEKTGTLINIPVSDRLVEIIADSPTGDLALIANMKTNAPMTKESFGNWFKEAATAAGVNGNCHGLRKAAASRLAEAGATIPELNAVFGWSGSKMASYYTEKASREKLADNAAAKLGR